MRTNRKIGRTKLIDCQPLERRRLFSTYVVNTISDSSMNPVGALTLREAVADANAHAGSDTISFNTTVFNAGSLHTITLTQELLEIKDTTGTTSIVGPGSATLAISGNNASRVFQVDSKVTAALSGLTITKGFVQSGANAAATGGGILNYGTLSLSSVTVSSSTARGGGPTDSNQHSGTAIGGGIYSSGPLTLSSCTVSNNSAVGGSADLSDSLLQNVGGGSATGGGIAAASTFTVTGSTITGNTASGGADNYYANGGSATGGGIDETGGITLTSSTVSSNTAHGGDDVTNTSGKTGGTAYGGGLAGTGKATLSSDTFSGDKAQGGAGPKTTVTSEFGVGGSAFGGAVYDTTTVAISGGSFTSDAAAGGLELISQAAQQSPYNPAPGGDARGGAVYTSGASTVSGATFSSDTAFGNLGYGGAIYSAATLSVASSTISGNTATGGDGNEYGRGEPNSGVGAGGGLFAAGSLTVTTSTITGNSAVGAAAEYYGSIGGTGEGGGVAAMSAGTITSSTLSNNKATGGLGGDQSSGTFGAQGGAGGFAEGGGTYSSAGLTLLACTISGNTATGGVGAGSDYTGTGGQGSGGGLFATSSLTLTNCTVANNNAHGGKSGTEPGSSVTSSNGGNATGGGLATSGSVLLSDVTISGNTTTAGSGQAVGVATGGGLAVLGGSPVLDNTIVSADKAGSSSSDIAGSVSHSSGYNLIGIGGGLTNGTNGNKVGVTNPELSSLSSNGGPTLTMLPLEGSPVIDAGKNSLVPSGVTTDQRGYNRFAGSAVDIGADEFASTPYGTASITGTIFNDVNANGLHDSGEGELANFTVYIDAGKLGHYVVGDPIVTSNSAGVFTFSNIAAGTYNVVATIPTGYRETYPTNLYYVVPVTAGQHVTGDNFLFSQKILVDGTVFDDANDNGVFDSTEKGLSGWTVYIDANNNGKLDSNEVKTVTNSAGYWSIGSLSAGNYTVRIVGQTNWKTTTPSTASFSISVGGGGIRANELFGEHFV